MTFSAEFYGNSAEFRTESLAGGAAAPPDPPARGKIGGRRPPKRPKLARKNGAEFLFGFRNLLDRDITIQVLVEILKFAFKLAEN